MVFAIYADQKLKHHQTRRIAGFLIQSTNYPQSDKHHAKRAVLLS
ncbi:hypothetical protein PPEP_b0769 [Pseudoalteromonas peptidolytica F12-50-A1]|uniref:Uncharacterized protein n=1 Tax=Pseudoalteromonas peptidolytica F12-50-A1 TaxID=1315280 RepID=A0A8I0N0J1_9GAMM|nr:hypothetical protein [Pseudoalteromonas peptidolytica F12-50-A1]